MVITRISVVLEGIADIMFDRFIDHSKEVRPPEQKLYLLGDNRLILPQDNITAFLFGDDITSGCARAFEGKAGRKYRSIGLAFVNVVEPYCFFESSGSEVKFSGFASDDLTPGCFWIHRGAAVTRQGSSRIKQPIKERPVLHLPWSLRFNLTVVENPLIDENKLHNYFEMGGLQIGIGTYRPKFGRFVVEKWEVS